MKIITTLPGNQEFFNRYAGLIPTLYRLGFLAQLISALTEVGIIYSIVYGSAKDFLPAAAPIMGICGAIIGTAMLEVGSRKFVPQTVRQVLHARFAGLDLVMSIFIFSVTIGLVAASGSLSFQGSREIIETIAPAPEQRTTATADSAYQAGRREAFEAYRTDSAAIAARIAGQVEAQRTAFASRIQVERAKLERYEARERSAGQSFASRKQAIRTRITEIEAERDQVVAGLQNAGALELAGADSLRRTTLTRLSGEHGQAKAAVIAFNEKSEAEATDKVDNYGLGLAWFSVLALCFFIFSTVLYEVNRKGSEMDEVAQVNQYDFSPSILVELREALNERWQHFTRSRIRRYQEKTPPAPLPLAPGALYNMAGLDQQKIEIKVAGADGAGSVIYLPLRGQGPTPPAPAGSTSPDLADQALQYVHAEVELENINLHAAAREMHLKAVDVIRAYLGPAATDQAVAELHQALVKFLNDDGPNPFEHHHRRPIGFKQKSEPKQEFCDNCGNLLEPDEGLQCDKCLNAEFKEAMSNPSDYGLHLHYRGRNLYRDKRGLFEFDGGARAYLEPLEGYPSGAVHLWKTQVDAYLEAIAKMKAAQPASPTLPDTKHDSENTDDSTVVNSSTQQFPSSAADNRSSTSTAGYVSAGDNIRPVGKSGNGPDNGPVIQPTKVIDNLLRVCDNCGRQYRARALNQRFCSTNCRLDYHSEKHDGKRFDPKMRLNKRKK